MIRNPSRQLVVLVIGGLLLAGWLHLSESSMADSDLATCHYVAANGDCGINTPCYAHVQAAVDAANDGDEVRVAAGLYTGVSDRNGTSQLVYLDKSITIRGGYHPQTWTPNPTLNPTILDAQGLGHVLFITGTVSPVVDGFHLTNGSATNGGGAYVDTAAVTLSHNEIYGNWCEGFGGGVFLKSSAATIVNNHIYTNTTGVSGRGGGLALSDSPATLDDNIIEDNHAHVGGGIKMSNSQGAGGANLTGNIIRDNVAFDLERDGYTFDGAGGGIDMGSSLTDTLKNNVISGNSAKWGGGIHAFGGKANIVNNTIQENNAPTHGGGLYAQGSQLTLESNDIISNTAGSWGGGLKLKVGNTSIIRGNTFQGNTAGWRGGGLYGDSAARFDGNLFLGNTATGQGGGAFLIHDSGAIYQNSVFVGNRAAEGAAIYFWTAKSILIHSTIANNVSGDGRAVVIDKYPGLVDPGAPTITTASVVFTNTIVAGHPVGFYATADNSLTVDGILWYETPTHFQADGVALTVQNELTGDPTFQADGYHLRLASAARDRVASTLDHDVDGQLRHWGGQKDLGADEYVPTVVIEPDLGATLAYTNPQQGVSITLSVPPNAITNPMGLIFSPLPPLPPGVMDSPFGSFIGIGPPFRLDPFHLDPSLPITDPLGPPLGDPSPPLTFSSPATVSLEYDERTMEEMSELLDSLALQLMALMGDSPPAPPQDPACGPVDLDLGNRKLDVPIGDTGIPAPTSLSVQMLPLHLLAVEPEFEAGTFIFVVEIEKTSFYLPLIMR